MESPERTMSTRLKQRAVIEFLTAEGVNPTDIHRRLRAVYGDGTIDLSTVNRWVIKFCASKVGKVSIEDEPRTGRPVRPVTVFWDAKHVYVTEYLEAGT